MQVAGSVCIVDRQARSGFPANTRDGCAGGWQPALFVVEADCRDTDGRTGSEDMGQAGDIREGAGSVDDQNGPPSRPALRIELPIGPTSVDEAQQPGYQHRPIVRGARHSSLQVRKPACPGPRRCGVVGQEQH